MKLKLFFKYLLSLATVPIVADFVRAAGIYSKPVFDQDKLDEQIKLAKEKAFYEKLAKNHWLSQVKVIEYDDYDSAGYLTLKVQVNEPVYPSDLLRYETHRLMYVYFASATVSGIQTLKAKDITAHFKYFPKEGEMLTKLRNVFRQK